MGLYDNRLSRIGIASLIVAILAPALPASAEDINARQSVHTGSGGITMTW